MTIAMMISVNSLAQNNNKRTKNINKKSKKELNVSKNETLLQSKEITITSIPTGAELEIDGLDLGMTPYRSTLSFTTHTIKLTNKKKVINENISISQDGKNKWEFNVYEFIDPTKEKIIIEEKPISFADTEVKPTFPGGEAALFKFLAKNAIYPESAKTKGIQGKVYVQFIIDKTGKVTNVSVVRKISPMLDAEAIRVVKMLPKWTPGIHKGKAVPVTYIVPITFKLF